MKEFITPYKEQPQHYSLDKWKEYERIVSSFKVFDINTEDQQCILEALHDELVWDWYDECNGANFVSEPGWKGKYHPPSLRHDYDWADEPDMKSNRTFKRLNIAYGMDRWRANLRFAGVTLSLPFYKFFNFF